MSYVASCKGITSTTASSLLCVSYGSNVQEVAAVLTIRKGLQRDRRGSFQLPPLTHFLDLTTEQGDIDILCLIQHSFNRVSQRENKGENIGEETDP